VSSTFDALAFAKGLVQPARDLIAPHLASFGDDAAEISAKLALIEQDVQLTIQAIILSNDVTMTRGLQEDLARFLPARRDAIMAIAAGKLASSTAATFDAVLAVVVKAAIIAAKAFL
jgi:hypothetical protein